MARQLTGKFINLKNEWRISINTGTPVVGDEIRIRKANGDVKTVFVSALDGTFDGKVICKFVERKTESAYSIVHLAGEIRPAEMLAALPRHAGDARARRAARDDARSAYEIRNQIGL